MYSLNCRGKLLSLESPLVMGILNITPDSFYTSDLKLEEGELVKRVRRMMDEGMDILDIGGQSTRPGSTRINDEEEWLRVEPVLKAVAQHFPELIVSIDTYHWRVAEKALAAGAHIINDISGGDMEPDILRVAGSNHAPFICMHMRGRPETMQQNPVFEDVTAEVIRELAVKTEHCLREGINDIVLDPGFGFGKTVEHNFTLLNNLSAFSMLQRPIVVGLSRKSMINKTLNIAAGEALNGTTVLNTIALMHGANILRVHDVRAARECVTLYEACRKSG